MRRGYDSLGPLPFLPLELPVQDPVRKGPHPASSFSAEKAGSLSVPLPLVSHRQKRQRSEAG